MVYYVTGIIWFQYCALWVPSLKKGAGKPRERTRVRFRNGIIKTMLFVIMDPRIHVPNAFGHQVEELQVFLRTMAAEAAGQHDKGRKNGMVGGKVPAREDTGFRVYFYYFMIPVYPSMYLESSKLIRYSTIVQISAN